MSDYGFFPRTSMSRRGETNLYYLPQPSAFSLDSLQPAGCLPSYMPRRVHQFVLSASAFSLQPRQPSACRLSTILYAFLLHYCNLLIPERVRGIILHPTPHHILSQPKVDSHHSAGCLPSYMPYTYTTDNDRIPHMLWYL